MARPKTEMERVRVWSDRTTGSNKVYDQWAKDYECERGAKYWTGKQWRTLTDDEAVQRYVINLIFPTLETQEPSLLFTRPKVRVSPRPPHSSETGSNAPARAQLAESAVQTFVDKPTVHFQDHTLLALKDAAFRFGVVEVGYSADWIDNPNGTKPILKEDSDDPVLDDTTGQPVLQPAKVVRAGSETLWLKRIPASTFRVSVSGRNILADNDWVGYYEWHYLEDLRANPQYRGTASLKATGNIAGTTPDTTTDAADPDRERHVGMVKVWKIWDLRGKVKHVFAEGHEKFLQEGKPFKTLPLAALKFYEILDEWYPLPVVYNWLSPQDEINESRDMQRVHRRRFFRRYTYVKGRIDRTELDKLETGEDGTYVEAKEENPIAAVPDAPLDGSNWTQLAATKEDFALITGVTAEQRGVPGAETATQANITNSRSQLRESRLRLKVGAWLAEISGLMLHAIIEHMQLPFWIQIATDPFVQNPLELVNTLVTWQQIEANELGDGLDLDVTIDLTSLSPANEEIDKANWMQILALLTQPAVIQLLFIPNPAAPDKPNALLRKLLTLNGVTAERDIAEIFRIGQQALALQMMQAAMQTAGAGTGGSPGVTAMPGAPGGHGPNRSSGVPSPAPALQ